MSAAATSESVFYATVLPKGRITIPAAMRRSMGVSPGDYVRFVPEEGGFRILRETEEIVPKSKGGTAE
jgi:AbrB family looped-hinge helix DNA binding protein